MKTEREKRIGESFSESEREKPYRAEFPPKRERARIAGHFSQSERKNCVGDFRVSGRENTLSKEREGYVLKDRHIPSFIESNAEASRDAPPPGVMEFEIFAGRNPPTVTAQEKKVAVGKDGKPHYYDPPGLARARAAICAELERHRPDAPFEGPVSLCATWEWQRSDGRTGWRDTKPDTDNVQKLLKDCMTRMRFWIDDAQVAFEVIGKRWVDTLPRVRITVAPLED